MKSKSRPLPESGPANTNEDILPATEPWVAAEAQLIDEARTAKPRLLAFPGLEPPAAFDFEVSRRLIEWDRMVAEYGRVV